MIEENRVRQEELLTMLYQKAMAAEDSKELESVVNLANETARNIRDMEDLDVRYNDTLAKQEVANKELELKEAQLRQQKNIETTKILAATGCGFGLGVVGFLTEKFGVGVFSIPFKKSVDVLTKVFTKII